MIVYLVLRPNGVAVINQLLRFYIVLETKGGCREGIPVDASNVEWEVPIRCEIHSLEALGVNSAV
jgi:hypothetical protein